MSRFNSFIKFIKRNHFVLTIGFVVGLIYILPNIFFIAKLGDSYQGIPMMHTANEDFYMARIQDILDGHPLLSSPAFFEYKDQFPLSPPVGEFIYALPNLIFGVSLIDTIIISRFLLPTALFFLIYYLIKRLTGSEEVLASRLNAVAGALWVTLGHDLVDYRNIIGFLAGNHVLSDSFLIWSRPVNPILGAIFLFSFLILVLAIAQNTKWRRTSVAGAGLLLALMIGSYFFSWGLAVSIVGFLMVIYFLKREYPVVKNLAFVLLFGFLFSVPYWYSAWQASRSSWYESSVLRSGLFYTHYPLVNKLLLAVFAVYVLAIVFNFFWTKKRGVIYSFRQWHWFCLAFLLGGLWVYNQQIITGMTVWPYHFVQYSIPLAIIVVMVLGFHIRKGITYCWSLFALFIIFISLLFGVYTQTSVYSRFYSQDIKFQSLAKLFDWLNQKEKDCVVLVSDRSEHNYRLQGLIPAFTQCNTYNSNWVFGLLMPDDHVYQRYLTRLFFKGVKPETIEDYLKNNSQEARGYLFSNWKGLYSVQQFPDFSDDEVVERIKTIPDGYRNFLKKNIKTKLSEYRLDYIVSAGELGQGILNQLPGTRLEFKSDDIFVYKFIK